jgi:hypothetical protein
MNVIIAAIVITTAGIVALGSISVASAQTNGTDPMVQKWAFALSQGEDEFNKAVKEQEKSLGIELPEGIVKAMHKTAEKYNIEHGIPSQKDNKNNEDVKDNKNNGNDNN